jgi:hypothetical protein
MKKLAALALITTILLAGCKGGDKAPQVKGASREPKTSYGQAIAEAKKAAKTTEDTQRKEAAEALGDDDNVPEERN